MIGFIEKNQNLSRKDRERLLKKHEILTAATKLFADMGYEKTTLDDIAETSEFGKGTLYNYFKNKEDIYKEILIKTISNYHELLVKINEQESSFKDFIKSLTLGMFSYCERDRETFNLLVRMRTDNSYKGGCCIHEELKVYAKLAFEMFDKRIKEAIKLNEITKMDTVSFMDLHRSMIFPYIHFVTMHNQGEIDFQKEADFVLSVLFNGILIK